MAPSALARGLATTFSKDSAVTSVCLLGSVARGDDTAASDVDLLVVSREERRPTNLLESAGPLGSDPRISLIVRSEELFEHLSLTGALFVLHVRLEGQTLFDRDRWLTDCLQATREVRPDPEATFSWAEGELGRYRDLRRFNGIFLFALARIYSVARALAIAESVRHGRPRFGRDGAFELVQTVHPAIRGEVERLRGLGPFHARAEGKLVTLPFDYHGATSQVGQALRDADQLLNSTRRA